MRYVLLSLIQTAGVLLLAALGVILGRWFSRLQSRAWLLGYAVPLVLVGMIALPRWVPRVESIRPFCWIMADRTEFAAMALIYTTLLTTPLCRLKQRRQRRAVAFFMLFFTGYFSVLPFLVPALAHPHLSRLETTIDRNGVCLQSNGYNCGPAAAVTVLREIGIAAEEGALALAAHSTRFAGTPTDSLCTAIRDQCGVHCRTVYCRELAELRGREPFIAVVKFGFLVDHYVAVLSVTDTDVTLGDPLSGMRKCTYEDFEKQWRRCAVLIEKGTAE
ncbi:MAG: hypothetical protein JXB62_06320 [Pirellulales bacterium]|nr:hypothetical protein [Pirellulales bacterium]